MTRPLKRPLYDNIVTLDPNGKPLYRCNKDKAKWYLKHELADVVTEEPLSIKLRFEPKGTGHAGDPFYLSEKVNVCVVCGSEQDHTRHHIVPYCFRRYFPDKLKQHSSHDIVLLCITCHDEYEVYADTFKNDLSLEYDVPFMGKGCFLAKELYEVKRHAAALKRPGVPPERAEKLYETLRKHFGKPDITPADVEAAAAIKPTTKAQDASQFGKRVMDQIGDLQGFVERWRKHFVDNMDPKFMPSYWRVERRLAEG